MQGCDSLGGCKTTRYCHLSYPTMYYVIPSHSNRRRISAKSGWSACQNSLLRRVSVWDLVWYDDTQVPYWRVHSLWQRFDSFIRDPAFIYTSQIQKASSRASLAMKVVVLWRALVRVWWRWQLVTLLFLCTFPSVESVNSAKAQKPTYALLCATLKYAPCCFC